MSASTYLRAVHLLLGAVLLLPYAGLVAMAVVVFRSNGASGAIALTLLMGVAFAIAFGIALLSPVRPLAIVAARGLLGVDLPDVTATAARTWSTRFRTAGWYWTVLILGSFATLVLLYGIPTAVGLISLPLGGTDSTTTAALEDLGWAVDSPGESILAVGIGLLILIATGYVIVGCGALLVRVAPTLLGPTPADRIEALRIRERELAKNNRLARELHDSIGHALTAVTMQAVAARRVLDSDVEFARTALGHIEVSGRGALDELDAVLATLRADDKPEPARTPDLADTDRLLSAVAGDVRVTVTGDRSRLPESISREAYRVLQEAVTNAVRHGDGELVDVLIAVSESDVVVRVDNGVTESNESGVGERRGGTAGVGGRGLTGMQERITLAGGTLRCGRVDAGAGAARWSTEARLPWEAK
ncbi:sensor histidine kinase [Rhodococcus sp. NPDC058521]|uniref:sensor histidine kinase n=1 Tax=Rhodococcus sp. NPDC058521 TaxID=3346536 RepID=UPI00365B9DD5